MRLTKPLTLLLTCTLAGGALLAGCEDRAAKDVEELRRELEETKRQAAKDVEDARAKASAEVAEKERELADARARRTDELAKDYTFADRSEYRDVRRRDLVDLDDEIAKLEQEAKQATGDAKRELDESLVSLKRRRDQLRSDIERAGDVTEREWDELKRGVDKAVTELRKDIRESWDSLKKRT